jgi:integrase
VDLRGIRESDIRRWRKERLTAGPRQDRPFGPVTVAKAYRLLHTVLNTATDDRLIRRNPCRIKGAGQEDSPERAVIPLTTLIELLDRVPPRYHALVLLATFASLRFGELAGLRRGQVDLDACAVRIVVATAETDDGRLIDDDPKSLAGRRRVAFPKEIAPELRWHLERFAQPGDDGLVFIGPKGGRLRRSTFRRTWTRVRTAVGLPGLHFHDLRHTGNTMAAGQGASLRELMERMGHFSARAALIYQHATQERDEAIAAGMGKLERGGRGHDLDRPAVFLGELDELANLGGGACATDDDGQHAAVLAHSVTPIRRAKSSAWRWTLSRAVVIRSRTRRRAAGRPVISSGAISSAARSAR